MISEDLDAEELAIAARMVPMPQWTVKQAQVPSVATPQLVPVPIEDLSTQQWIESIAKYADQETGTKAKAAHRWLAFAKAKLDANPQAQINKVELIDARTIHTAWYTSWQEWYPKNPTMAVPKP